MEFFAGTMLGLLLGLLLGIVGTFAFITYVSRDKS